MTQTPEGVPAMGRPLGRRARPSGGGGDDAPTGPIGAGPPGGGPALAASARPARAPTGRAAEGGRPVGVLVVDDSPVFRTGMSRAVQAHDGLELVGEAESGESALRAIDDLRPDLVILDLRMPGLDGLGVLERLRAREPPASCRVLAISASIEDGVADHVTAAGADACLSKALSRAEICAMALRLAAH